MKKRKGYWIVEVNNYTLDMLYMVVKERKGCSIVCDVVVVSSSLEDAREYVNKQVNRKMKGGMKK